MALTTTESLGFTDGVIEFLTNNQTALLAAGLDVSTYITQLGTQKEDAVTKNDQQETPKAQLRTKTDEVNTALSTLYNNTSTKLDTARPLLDRMQEIREKTRRPEA